MEGKKDIYDLMHSVLLARKKIIKHYNILNDISTYNHQKGHTYLNLQQCINMILENKTLLDKLKLIDKM